MIIGRTAKKAYGIIYGVIMIIYIILMFRGQIIERRIENEFDFFNLEKSYESTGKVYKDEISRLKEDALKRYSLGGLEYIYANAAVGMFKNEIDTYTVFRGSDDKNYHVHINAQLTSDFKMESFIGKINETTGIMRETDVGMEFRHDSVYRNFKKKQSKNTSEIAISLVVMGGLGFIQMKFFNIEKDELDEYELQTIIDKWEEVEEKGKRIYTVKVFIMTVMQMVIPPILINGMEIDFEYAFGISFIYFFVVILVTAVSSGISWDKREKEYIEAKEKLESIKSKNKRKNSREEIV